MKTNFKTALEEAGEPNSKSKLKRMGNKPKEERPKARMEGKLRKSSH